MEFDAAKNKVSQGVLGFNSSKCEKDGSPHGSEIAVVADPREGEVGIIANESAIGVDVWYRCWCRRVRP